MSSLPVSTDLYEKRTRFLRNGSFERLKCTAATHFQLAGSSFSKTSLAQLFEWVITKSRGIFQHTILFLSLPILKCLCGCAVSIIELLTMLIGFNLIKEKTSSKLYEKSQRFLSKIEHIRAIRLQQKITNDNNIEISPKITTSEKDLDDNKKELTIVNAINDIKQEEYKEIPIEICDKTVCSTTLICSAKEQLLKKPVKKSTKPNGLLIICVYGSTSFVYIQLMLLVVSLQSAYTPPGLVFLLVSLSYIGYIVHKVLSSGKVKVSRKVKTKKTQRQSSTNTGLRLTQLANRKFLDFHNKTLSKIQLL